MWKSTLLICLFAFSLFLNGCVFGEKVALQNKFDPELYARALAAGPNTVSGSSALWIERKLAVDVICKCGISQGAAVYLMPVTPVTTELMVRLFGNDRLAFAPITKLPNTNGVDKNIFYKAGRGDCDRFGNFTFNNVADGSYYLWIETRERKESGRGYELYGGTLMKKITVQGGQRVTVNMMYELGVKPPALKGLK